ncbi:hypothetical protein [Streptomyces sp. NBC_01304]|uniref:hypothetical protein n=1 Tax=Streptomyces sp. NBC_01304 TaxID=2903818 RepID=UPI002E149EB7|nr:hypothetical protein OG430_47740 [Streptomyces sp. NBC_01304]
MVDEARRNAVDTGEHELLCRVDAMRPFEVLDAFEHEGFVNADLLKAVGAVLRHLAPAQYGDAEQEELQLCDYDFRELVAFASKAENEGFWYAYAEYGPEFESPAARAVVADPRALEDLLKQYEKAIDGFWEQPDAETQYDAHLGERDRRDKMAKRRATV